MSSRALLGLLACRWGHPGGCLGWCCRSDSTMGPSGVTHVASSSSCLFYFSSLFKFKWQFNLFQ